MLGTGQVWLGTLVGCPENFGSHVNVVTSMFSLLRCTNFVAAASAAWTMSLASRCLRMSWHFLCERESRCLWSFFSSVLASLHCTVPSTKALSLCCPDSVCNPRYFTWAHTVHFTLPVVASNESQCRLFCQAANWSGFRQTFGKVSCRVSQTVALDWVVSTAGAQPSDAKTFVAVHNSKHVTTSRNSSGDEISEHGGDVSVYAMYRISHTFSIGYQIFSVSLLRWRTSWLVFCCCMNVHVNSARWLRLHTSTWNEIMLQR